jgi:hypothetical protein
MPAIPDIAYSGGASKRVVQSGTQTNSSLMREKRLRRYESIALRARRVSVSKLRADVGVMVLF